MTQSRRFEQAGIAALILIVVVVPTAIHGWPRTLVGNVFTAALLAGGLTLVWWRTRPRQVVIAGGAFWFVTAALGDYGWFPDTALVILPLLAAVVALGWSGRQAWLAAGCLVAYLVVIWLSLEMNVVPLFMFSLPGFAAGTVLRLHRETADDLAQRGQELEEERELFADLARRQERARIAAELHDIVGHAISVMVIQAAAGQRLVDNDPAGAQRAFGAIAESARQGREDLQRLVDLLGRTEIGGPDLSLIEEVVGRAARSGLEVSCRFTGDRDGVAAPTAHLAFRVVQESLTNALRYAPGSAVRVLVDGAGRGLSVSVENDLSTGTRTGLAGTGHGLTGLRERIDQLGGTLSAGPTAYGGWLVSARLPKQDRRTP